MMLAALDRIEEIRPPATGSAVATPNSIPLVSSTILPRDAPLAHYHGIRGGDIVARCSIWTEDTPGLNGKPLGVIGHYAATDLPAGSAILNHAIAQLARHDRHQIVGPMDGNTWRSYRLITERGSEPPFLLEIKNPDDWPAHWLAAGFTPLATYHSGLNEDLSVTDPRVPATMKRFEESGTRIRTVDMSRFEQELSSVHDLSLESFADNFLYTPTTREQFLAMYVPLREKIVPELVLLAEHGDGNGGRIDGFMFGVPNLPEAANGRPIRTAVAKTLAVRPGRTGAGLGSILMDRFQQNARMLGFTRVIHAFMHDRNVSVKITSRYGRVMRRYTLYGKGI